MPFLVAAEYQWADVQTALLLQMIKCSTPVVGLRHRIKLPALGRMYVVTSVVYDPIVPVRAGTPGSPDDLSNLTSEVDKGKLQAFQQVRRRGRVNWRTPTCYLGHHARCQSRPERQNRYVAMPSIAQPAGPSRCPAASRRSLLWWRRPGGWFPMKWLLSVAKGRLAVRRRGNPVSPDP